MKVFVVEQGIDYEPCPIAGVFSTRVKAEQEIVELEKAHVYADRWDVYEIELDSPILR